MTTAEERHRRIAFESWLASLKVRYSTARYRDDGAYRDMAVELAWKAWNEATRLASGGP